MMNNKDDKTRGSLFNSYPRIRPRLSSEAAQIYEKEYQLNRGRQTFLTKIVESLEAWMHKKVAVKQIYPALELGAGTLNHLKYENVTGHYDIVEPFRSLYENNVNLYMVRNIYDRIKDIPSSQKYNRILSIAVLEHMLDLPREIELAIDHLDPQGVFQAGIPSEGGIMWGLSWRLTTGISYRIRTGLNYRELMRHEHVNSANEILEIINFYFKTVNVSQFPLPFFHGSFYTYIEAKL